MNIRQVTCGNTHAAPGDPRRVVEYYDWLMARPGEDLPPIQVREKPNGTYRVYDGRHRFLSYVLAEREVIPVVVIATPDRVVS